MRSIVRAALAAIGRGVRWTARAVAQNSHWSARMRTLVSLLGLSAAVALGCSSPGTSNPDQPDGGVTDAGTDGRIPTDGRPPIDAAIDAPIDAAEIDDCDPDGPIHPGATEVIDGVDNDCDGLIDEVTACATGGDYATIGAAIAAAPPGGTIFICAGTYAERLTITAKPLDLRGEGAGTTRIDAGAAGTALTITGTGAPGVTLSGLAIGNGRTATQGGGIHCSGSTLTLRDLRLEANVAQAGGGGLYATGCQLTLTGVVAKLNQGGPTGGGALLVDSTGEIATSAFHANRAVNGGGVALTEGSVAILDSMFQGNVGVLRGGAIYSNSDSLIAGNTIVENDAPLTGGGLHIVAHAPMIRNNEIRANHSENDGGGVYLHQSQATLLGNHVIANVSDDDGGGIRVFESMARLEGNLIEDNYAADGGGGIRVSHVPSLLIDNVVRNNEAGNTGGGMDLDNDASTVRGGEVTGNRASSGGGIFAWLAPWSGLRLENLRIADNNAWRGGGIFLDDNFTVATLSGLLVENNHANRGAGLMVRATNYVVKHSLFRGNTASTRGGAIYAGVPSQTSGWTNPCPPCPPTEPIGRILFTTFHENEADLGGAVWMDEDGTQIENSIMADNDAPQIAVEAPLPTEANPMPASFTPRFRYNDVMPPSYSGMADPTGIDGNLGAAPMFVDPVAGDFHLLAESACVNAADPAMHDADGSRADMGMFGGTP